LQSIFETIDLFPSPREPTFKDTPEVTLLRFLRRKEPLDAIMRNSPGLRREKIAWDNEGFLPRFHDTVLKMQRRLMVTDQEHVGMAPARATKHDGIAVLCGCSVPVVLRPLHDDTGYEFIAECYVHGPMEGEILGELEAGSKKQETFVLR
jgi:hypothetical protein